MNRGCDCFIIHLHVKQFQPNPFHYCRFFFTFLKNHPLTCYKDPQSWCVCFFIVWESGVGREAYSTGCQSPGGTELRQVRSQDCILPEKKHWSHSGLKDHTERPQPRACGAGRSRCMSSCYDRTESLHSPTGSLERAPEAAARQEKGSSSLREALVVCP